MTLSEERITHLSHLVFKALKTHASYNDEKKALAAIKTSIHDFGGVLDAVDGKIRQKIASLKRQVPEGSREWDLLYRQYFEEELTKKDL